MAIPTETVYGLAAPIFDQEAIQKIFFLKKRPQDNPLIAHISNYSMLERIAADLPPLFLPLAQRFWPGPLTLVVPKHHSVPSIVSAGHATLAVRMPAHPLALQLIDALDEPLVAPSANLSGRPSPTTADHVLEDLDGQLAAVLDGGPCQWGIESTVLSLLQPQPILLRPGSIAREELEEFLGQPLLLPEANAPVHSPGMKYRHYAPKARIRIVTAPEEAIGPFLLSREPVPGHPHRPLYPQNLYRYLREADALQIEEICVFLDPLSSRDEGLMNRLLKAAQLC